MTLKENKDYFTTEPDMKDDVEVIGTVEATKPIDEGSQTFYGLTRGKKYFCSSCKKGLHNQYEDDKVCKKDGCKCLCQFGYIGKNGRTIIKWGKKDNSKFRDEGITTSKKVNVIFEKLILQLSKLKHENTLKTCPRCDLQSRYSGDYCKDCELELNQNSK